MIFEDDNNVGKNGIGAPINNVDTLWVEKYRPKILDDVIIPKRVRTQIQYLIDNGITRHILMYGSAGTGKTTIARILCANKNSLSINASEENGIETIRDRIIPFTQTSGMSGGTKIAFLDEIDNLSNAATLAFRGVIESGAKTVRFIGTCNYPERMSEPIKSRFGIKINFDFKGDENKEVLIQKVKRIKHICEQEGLEIENDAIILLIGKMNDMRDIIENLQNMYEMGIKKIKKTDIESNLEKKYDKFYETILSDKTDIFAIRNFIVNNYPNMYYNLIVAMGDELCMWLKENKHPLLAKAHFIYALGHKFKVDSMGKPDVLTSLLASIVELQFIIFKK